MDIADFLRARFDEDQAHVAQGYVTAPAIPDFGGCDKPTTAGLPPAVAMRAMAGFEAKRRIIELCAHVLAYEEQGLPLAQQILELLALPYTSHPDYEAAWAPSV